MTQEAMKASQTPRPTFPLKWKPSKTTPKAQPWRHCGLAQYEPAMPHHLRNAERRVCDPQGDEGSAGDHGHGGDSQRKERGIALGDRPATRLSKPKLARLDAAIR